MLRPSARLAGPASSEPLTLPLTVATGISERQLWQKTDEGEIRCVKIGGCKVHPVDALRQYLAELAERQKLATASTEV